MIVQAYEKSCRWKHFKIARVETYKKRRKDEKTADEGNNLSVIPFYLSTMVIA